MIENIQFDELKQYIYLHTSSWCLAHLWGGLCNHVASVVVVR
jgi:hypothetical protein